MRIMQILCKLLKYANKTMKIREKIQADLKEAMKMNNTVKRDTLRFLNSLIKNAEIKEEKQKSGLEDQEMIKIINSAVKQRRESADQYRKGKRVDLAEKEERELKILSAYLPRQLPVKEIEEIVKSVVRQTGAQSGSDMGKVMGAVMSQLSGRADGNLVKKITEKILA